MEARLVAAAKGWMSTLRMIIDGGGTSTAVAVFDGAAERARTTLPPYRPTSDGLHTESLCHHLATWCAATAIPTEHIGLLLVGMAGVWSTEEKRVYADAVRRDWEAECATPSPNVIVLADIELVQFAALHGRPGIVLIAGTGSMGLGVSLAGAMVRCGGWGPRIDDAGGGFWIGREALRAVAHMIDGIGPSTHLIRPVAAWLRVGPEDLRGVADRLRSTTIDGVARLAPAVFTYAAEGDAVAASIVTAAADALATLVRTIVRHHPDVPALVVRYGSLWQQTSLCHDVERLVRDVVPEVEFETVDDVLSMANGVVDRIT